MLCMNICRMLAAKGDGGGGGESLKEKDDDNDEVGSCHQICIINYVLAFLFSVATTPAVQAQVLVEKGTKSIFLFSRLPSFLSTSPPSPCLIFTFSKPVQLKIPILLKKIFLSIPSHSTCF